MAGFGQRLETNLGYKGILGFWAETVPQELRREAGRLTGNDWAELRLVGTKNIAGMVGSRF